MHIIKTTTARHPLASTAIFVFFFIGALLLLPSILSSDESTTLLVRNIYRYAASFLILGLLLKLGWAKDAGITTPMRDWGRKWGFAAIPMLCIGLINFTAVDTGKLEFNLTAAVVWVLDNLAAGLFEETVLRGLCFYILYRAWGQTRRGLYSAAITQATVFGLLHMLNLRHEPTVDVGAQVIFATLIGIGFVGLVAYAKTLWVPVIVHTLINASGSLNEFFLPGYVDAGGSIGGYTAAIILIFFLSTLPGLWCLKKAPLAKPDSEKC